MAQQAAEQQLLAVAETIERALDDELDRMDNMDENDLAAIRRKRIDQLKVMQKRKEGWLAKGHGIYQEINDPTQFFEWAKRSERVVVHFGRSGSERCNILDHHFKKLAPAHFETLFCRVDCEKLQSLPAHFHVMMLPTIMLIEGGNTFHSIIGFDEMGGKDDFTTETFVKLLMHYGMLNENGMFAADQSVDE
jgi:hypothetical protein